MEFYDLLVGGGSTKSVAKSFVDGMIASQKEASGDWWSEVSCNFIVQCFRSVGLKCTITAEQLKVSRRLKLHEENSTYVFAYDATYFRLIEKFFQTLESVINSSEQLIAATVGDGVGNISPLHGYATILSIWNETCQHIGENQNLVPLSDVFYLEPIARLNFFILKHLVKLEQKYVSKYPIIENLCVQISRPVIFGLYYERTHKIVLEGMLDIIVDNRVVFFRESIKLWEFYYCVLICKRKESSLKVFSNLTNTIRRWADDSNEAQYLRILTNNLINAKMINMYYTILNECTNEALSASVLGFLDVLQHNVVSLESFSKDFISILLLVVIDQNYDSVRKMAAQLYISIAKKLQPNRAILNHILEEFLESKAMSGVGNDFHGSFNNYITEMYSFFPIMRYFKPYLAVLMNPAQKNEVRTLAAHAVVFLVDLYISRTLIDDQQIVWFFKKLPNIMAQLDIDKRTVICGIFTELDYQKFANNVENAKSILDGLEDCCLLLLYNKDHIVLHQIGNVFQSAIRSIAVTNNDRKLKSVADDINDDFIAIEQELSRCQIRNEMPPEELIATYYYTLRRLSLMLQAKTIYSLDVPNIFNALRARFLPKSMYNMNSKSKFRLDYVAYEVIATAAALLRYDFTSYDATKMIEELRALMLQARSKDYELMKTLFTSIVLLHIGYSRPGPDKLTLTKVTYSLLLGTLTRILSLCGAESIQSYHDNMRHMLVAFQRLIMVNQLPDATIWKLAVYYMLVKPFEQELREIVSLLLHKHTSNYIQAFPVVVYKLNVLKPTLSEFKIKNALKAHLTLIDGIMPRPLACRFKLHVYISSLEIIVKSISVASPGSTRNRLLPLRCLMELIKKLRLSDEIFDNIDKVAQQLKDHTLNASERETLKRYNNELGNFKELCRKEIV